MIALSSSLFPIAFCRSKIVCCFNFVEREQTEEYDVLLRILAGRILRKYGYNVMEAGNGKEALNLVREYSGEIHLVVTDMVMPGMSGKELISQLNAIRPGIRALFVSGYVDDMAIKKGVLDDTISFLQKPFTAGDLIRSIQDAIG